MLTVGKDVGLNFGLLWITHSNQQIVLVLNLYSKQVDESSTERFPLVYIFAFDFQV